MMIIMMILINIMMIFIMMMIFMIIMMILIKHFHHEKIFTFFLCMYKMVNINKDTYENSDIEAIVDSIGTLWLNEKNIEEKLGHKNLPAITNKYDQEYKQYRHELVNNPEKQPNRRF